MFLSCMIWTQLLHTTVSDCKLNSSSRVELLMTVLIKIIYCLLSIDVPHKEVTLLLSSCTNLRVTASSIICLTWKKNVFIYRSALERVIGKQKSKFFKDYMTVKEATPNKTTKYISWRHKISHRVQYTYGWFNY